MIGANVKEEYFEEDKKPNIKTEFKEDTHYEDDNHSTKQEECDDNTDELKFNIHVKSEKVSMIAAANMKEEYFEEGTKPNFASL